MSSMIRCDRCKKLMYGDSRSDKGDYYLISVNVQPCGHLCKDCFTKFADEFFPYLKEEYRLDEEDDHFYIC